MLTKDSRVAEFAEEIFRERAKYYGTMMAYVSTDPLFPAYTYRYDPDTNILTQYKNGVESVRMFVPDKFSLKESL